MSCAVLAVYVVVGASPAPACVIAPELVTDADLPTAPAGMIAIRAEIAAIDWHGPQRGTPNSGFTLELHPRKAVMGASEETLIVRYGPCNRVPGKVGDTVPVLARRLPDGTLMAPQFPPRMWPAAMRSGAN